MTEAGRGRGKSLLAGALAVWATVAATPPAAGSPPSAVPAAGEGSAARKPDPEEATRAYLARMTPEKKARSDAYFEGGCWLQLWGFLYGVGVAWWLLAAGWSAWLRDAAERVTRRRPLQTLLYWGGYCVLTSLLLFPLTLYEGFVREHRYGLATQSFGPWFGDRLKELGVAIVLGGVAVTLLYGVVRRAPRTWWLWGALATSVLFALSVMIAPVYIAPLFNKYTPLEDARVREPILSLARANGIGVTKVYVVDASRQTTRISANVSGLFGTQRISLNDNLLERCSLAEIESVMGHEMGHYVLHHLSKGIVFFFLLAVVAFAFLRAGFAWMIPRRGGKWGVRSVGDVAGVPVFAILIACYLFVLTPVTNSITRLQEAEADIFGLNASRQPDGFAEVTLKLAEYRKLDPSPLEEFLFYDHPSGRSRILAAMRWKAEQKK